MPGVLGDPALSCRLLPSRPLPMPCLSCQKLRRAESSCAWSSLPCGGPSPCLRFPGIVTFLLLVIRASSGPVQTLRALRSSGRGMRGLGVPSVQSPCSREHTARGPSEPPLRRHQAADDRGR